MRAVGASVSLNFALPEGSLEPAVLERSVTPDAMLQLFRRYLPPRHHTTWERCEPVRVRYLPGRSWHILYRLWAAADPADAPPLYYYAEFLPPELSLHRFVQLQDAGGLTAPSGYVAELNMIYWRFPADPRLSQLPSVWQEGRWHVVSYLPGILCTLAGEYAGERTILKLYSDDRNERVGRVMQALHAAGTNVPRVLHVDTPRRLLVLEHVPGIGFWADPAPHLQREVMAAMARALDRLHAAELGADTHQLLQRVEHASQEWKRIQQAVLDLSEAFPPHAARLRRLANMLEPVLEETPAPVLVHGSFHPAQFLIDAGVPRLFDFDTVCLGDPMFDLARFASYLYDRGQARGQPMREIERAVSAFRSAYITAAAGRFHAARWFWHLSVALVAKRAQAVLARLEANAADLVGHLITIAEQNAVSIVRD